MLELDGDINEMNLHPSQFDIGNGNSNLGGDFKSFLFSSLPGEGFHFD